MLKKFKAVLEAVLRALGILASIRNSINNWRARRRNNKLAKDFFGEFKEFVDRFGDLIDPNRADRITFIIERLQSEEGFKDISPPPVRFEILFNCFKEAVNHFDGTKKKGFSILAKLFDAMATIYNEQYVCKPIDEIREREISVPKRIKEIYNNKYRFTYMKFQEDYIEFGNKVNKAFGERIFTTYWDRPKEL